MMNFMSSAEKLAEIGREYGRCGQSRSVTDKALIRVGLIMCKTYKINLSRCVQKVSFHFLFSSAFWNWQKDNAQSCTQTDLSSHSEDPPAPDVSLAFIHSTSAELLRGRRGEAALFKGSQYRLQHFAGCSQSAPLSHLSGGCWHGAACRGSGWVRVGNERIF